jgi:hypothetical protein
MNPSWKPEAYNAVSVYIVADGAQAVIDFLKKTFGATQLRRFDNPDGKIMHAEVCVADTVIMIADAGGDYPSFPVWLACLRLGRRCHLSGGLAGRRRIGSGAGPQRARHRQARRLQRSRREHIVGRNAGGMIRKTFGGLLLHNFEPVFLDHRIRQHFLRNLF